MGLDAAPTNAPTGLSLQDAFDRFMTARRSAKPSQHTVAAYAADLRGVAGFMCSDAAEVPLTGVDARWLQSAFAAFADTRAKASVARAWSTWNQLFQHLVAAGDAPGNPMAAVPKARVPKSAPHAFTESDMAALIDTLANGRIPARNPWPIRDYAIITTLAVTGLRRGELLDLTIGDLEGPEGARIIAVRHGKGDKYRAVPVDPRLEALITAYLADRWVRFPSRGRSSEAPWQVPPRTPLWVGDGGEAMSTGQLARLVERAYRAAGINSHRPPGALVHALRHTFATALIENGATAIEVMGLLGHASLQTTQRYLATRPDQLRDAVRSNPVYSRLPEPGARAEG